MYIYFVRPRMTEDRLEAYLRVFRTKTARGFGLASVHGEGHCSFSHIRKRIPVARNLAGSGRLYWIITVARITPQTELDRGHSNGATIAADLWDTPASQELLGQHQDCRTAGM